MKPHVHTTPIEDLSECTCCRGRKVHPVEWHESSATHWHVLLRCPDCESWREGNFDQRTVDLFDAALDAGIAEIAYDLRVLERQHMAEEADRFAAALAIDAILPEDF